MGVLTTNEGGLVNLALSDGGSVLALINATLPPALLPPFGVLAVNPFAGIPIVNIDPQNVSGVASDANTGAPGSPVLTWNGGVIAKYGTFFPVITAAITFVFISSHTDNTDPVIFAPYYSARVIIQGAAPTVVTAGVVLSATTAKSRVAGANSMLLTNLGATATTATMIQNTTHPSRCFPYKSLGANSFDMYQPFVAGVPGATFIAPAEVDTWANGDTVNILSPIAINIVAIAPAFIGPATAFTIYQCAILQPAANSFCTINSERAPISILEVRCNRTMIVSALLNTNCANCSWPNGLISNGPAAFIGGGVANESGFTVCFIASPGTNAAIIDGDFIVGASASGATLDGLVNLGIVFLDQTVQTDMARIICQTDFYGSHVLYGSGANTINLRGSSHLHNVTGTFVAAFTAPGLITGIQLNGTATASSHTNATPDVIASGIATTPANLDAAAGPAGFGGNAFRLGGASVSNF